MAMGATAANVLKLVVGRAMWMVVAGSVLGIGVALGLTRFLTALLFGVGATDPVTYVSLTSVLVAVALVASVLPAKQATRVDPLTTLRSE
jgi:ABC-type antimicrobial peptide transport system permease subunit